MQSAPAAVVIAGTVACLAAACWTGGTPPPPSPASPASAPSAAPRGPAPTVRWIDNWLEGFELPAISDDGSRIVYADHEEDGGRGNPNLAIMIKDRRDGTLSRQVVLAADEADTLFDASGMKPALRERIAAANESLANVHAKHDLHPLQLIDTRADPLAGLAGGTATGLGLHLTWAPSRLVIQHGGRTVVDTATPATWLAPDRPTCDGCPPCSNRAYLGPVYADPQRRVVLLTISYAGTDLCWEPNSQRHVVSW